MALVPISTPIIENNSIHQILPDIYLGNKDALLFVEKCGIQSVLQIGTETEFKEYRPVTCHSLQLMFEDKNNTNISVYFNHVKDFINKAPKPLLIHCNAGVSRSVSLLVSYLITLGYTMDSALNLITEKRGNSNIYTQPKPNFKKQLKQWEKATM